MLDSDVVPTTATTTFAPIRSTSGNDGSGNAASSGSGSSGVAIAAGVTGGMRSCHWGLACHLISVCIVAIVLLLVLVFVVLFKRKQQQQQQDASNVCHLASSYWHNGLDGLFLQGEPATGRRKSSIAPLKLDSIMPPKAGGPRRGSFTYVAMEEDAAAETALKAPDPVGYLELQTSTASLET